MKNKKVILIILITLIIMTLGLLTVRIIDYTRSNQNRDLNESVNNKLEDQNFEEVEEDTKDSNFVSSGTLINVLSYEELATYLIRETTSILVIGQTGCSHCERYYPILENISSEYNLEILYLDLKKLDDADYNLVKNSNITIPSKCNNHGEDITLNKRFGTPMTLFINEDKTFDCIRGYTDKDNFLDTLKNNNLIN